MLATSDLIVNPDGTIYHLGLSREHLADTILTVGDPDRVEMFAQRLDAIEHRSKRREFVALKGRLGNRTLLVLSTGIGVDNVEIALTELDALARLDLSSRIEMPTPQQQNLRLIRVGTTGAIDASLAPGQIIVSALATGLDSLANWYDTEGQFAADPSLTHYLGLPEGPYTVPATWLEWLSGWPEALGVVAGHTLTAPGFYLPQGRATRVRAAAPWLVGQPPYAPPAGQPILTNLEMETAGLYLLAHQYGHQAVSVSVALVNRRTGAVCKDMPAATERLIEAVLARIG